MSDTQTPSYIKTPLWAIDPNLPPGALNFERILFLDFDGVLHPEGCGMEMNFCFMTNFCDVLREVDPQGEMPIVVSSMWRFDTSIEKLRDNFPDDIGRQIIGVTPDLPAPPAIGWERSGATPSSRGQRQKEIQAWMRENSPCGEWLAIDDRPSWFEDDCPHLFAVPGLYDETGGGISIVIAIDLQERLQKFLEGASPVAKSRLCQK